MEALFNYSIHDSAPTGLAPSSGRACGSDEGPAGRAELYAVIGVLAFLLLLLAVAVVKQNWEGVKVLLGAIQQQLTRIPHLLGRGQPEGEGGVELGPVPAAPSRSAGVPRNRSDDEILACPRARSVPV